MANPKILYSDVSAYVCSSSAGTNATYPLTNLNNYMVNSYWVGSTTVSQRLVFDIGVAIPVTDFVIDGHNLTGVGASVSLQSATNAAFTTGIETICSLDEDDDVPLHVSFASTTKRYFAIYYTPSGVAAPRIGNIMIGTPLEFTTPYDNGFKPDVPEHNTTEFMTLSGQKRTSQQYKARLVWELKFSLQSTALKTAYQTFVRTVRGKMYPFYFIDTDGTTIRYMNLDSDYNPVVSTGVPGFWNIESLKMSTNQSVY
jgi:hypothetical protein